LSNINTFVYVFFAVSKFSISFYTEQLLITEKNTRIVLSQLYDVQQNYLLGLGSMIIVGLLNIGLLILGIDYPLWFHVLLLVPYRYNHWFAFTSSSSLSHKKDYYCMAHNSILWFLHFIEGNFITPKITGSKVSLNSFICFILAIILFSMKWEY
jgi:predicted PurR-regulated permease PerM